MLLAIDTSTQIASVALYHNGMLQDESTWWSQQNHTAELMPAIINLLGRQGLTPSQLEGIAVALGPGSFNGIRVGVSTAKGLAYALGLPLVGVSTLEILAYAHSLMRIPIRPILPAGRGQINTALFRNFRHRWCRLEEDRITTWDEICIQTVRRTVFCGEIGQAEAERLRQDLGRLAVILPPAANWRRAGYLAELAWQRLQAGLCDDPITLQPIYLRRPSIGGIP